jgi:hypothetical protein
MLDGSRYWDAALADYYGEEEDEGEDEAEFEGEDGFELGEGEEDEEVEVEGEDCMTQSCFAGPRGWTLTVHVCGCMCDFSVCFGCIVCDAAAVHVHCHRKEEAVIQSHSPYTPLLVPSSFTPIHLPPQRLLLYCVS